MSEPKFTIENNVLKGQAKSTFCKYSSVGQFLFDKLTENEKLASQIDAVTGKEETFGQVLDRSIRCALWMRKQGIQPGDMVLLSTHNHLDSAVPLFAALFSGVAISCLDPTLYTREYQHTLSIVKPKLAFANEKCAKLLRDAARSINLSVKVIVFGNVNIPGIENFSQTLERQDSEEIVKFRCTKILDPNHTAVLLFTSGTTGFPKAVMISHFAILKHFLTWDWNISNMSSLMLSSLHWITAVYSTIFTGLLGTKRVLVPHFEEEFLSSVVDKFKPQWCLLGPAIINQLLKSNIWTKYDFSSLEYLVIAGGTLNKNNINKLEKYLPCTTIIQTYGMTELGGLIVVQREYRKKGSSGVVVDNVEVKVIDIQNGKALGPNSSGEICIRGPSTMTGYYGNPEATKNIIDSEGWLHSGDLAFYNEDGEIFILDRLKDFVEHKGYPVSPSEVESVIMEHPGVKEVAVVGLPHPIDIERPVAFVTRVPGTNVTEKELVDMVAEQLSFHKQLTGGVKFLDEMPYTSTGKIQRNILRALVRSLAVDA